MWPADAETLVAAQYRLAGASPERWVGSDSQRVGACWVCFPHGLTGRGSRGDPSWCAAVAMAGDSVVDRYVVKGTAGAPYEPGLLALRMGPMMEQGIRALSELPDVLVVDATARDHPRAAGLALHLGAELDRPTVGVTHRPLNGSGVWPIDVRGATSPIRIGDRVVACWLRTRAGTRPLVVHPGWRVDLTTAVDLVSTLTTQHRTPEPLREARRLARSARAAAAT